MGQTNRRSGAMWRGFVVLATLALLVQILVPQGFMVSAAGSTPGLVICTGHGPLLSPGSPSHPGKALYDKDAATPGNQPDHSYFTPIRPYIAQLHRIIAN